MKLIHGAPPSFEMSNFLHKLDWPRKIKIKMFAVQKTILSHYFSFVFWLSDISFLCATSFRAFSKLGTGTREKAQVVLELLTVSNFYGKQYMQISKRKPSADIEDLAVLQ